MNFWVLACRGDAILHDLYYVLYRHDSNNDLCRNNSKEKAKEAIFYSYTRYFNGFAAILEDEEAAEISSKYHKITISYN
jgi:hypothetical protein